jgi:hypothetical protein
MSLARYLSKLGAMLGSDGKVPTSALGAGAVLRIVQARKTDKWSNSTTSFASVDGLSVTLTPASVNSKFLVEASVYVGANWWASNGGYFGINANGTVIAGSGTGVWSLQYGADVGNSPFETQQWSESGIHSPSSISPITFNVVLASGVSGQAIYVNRSNNDYTKEGKSVLTITEIAG